MRKRFIKKHIELNENEFKAMQKKMKKLGLEHHSHLIRKLINEYEPDPKPNNDFYEALEPTKRMSRVLNNIAHRFNRNHYIDSFDEKLLKKTIAEMNELMLEIREKFFTKSKIGKN